jgi:glycosyltransferase involved in cell wall biosynthesis
MEHFLREKRRSPALKRVGRGEVSGETMHPVSVIIPTYNQAKLLVETIDSILSQTYSVAEIVIVDDGSSDETAEVVRKMPSKVKYHYKSNGGICAARNDGARFTTSPYIAFCDHDDLWKEDKLAKQMQLHERVPQLQYSFTNFAIISDGIWASSSKFDDAPSDFFYGCKGVSEFGALCETSLYEKVLRFQPIFPSTILMTADLFRRIGGFNEAFGSNPAEDLEFTLRCLQRGPVGIISDPCVGIRKHRTNFSGDNYRNMLGGIEVLRYALTHHSIPESTKEAIRNAIEIRRVGASYGAFALQEFDVCRDLLSGLPKTLLTPKLRAKRFISSCPTVIAKPLHSILTRTRMPCL